MWTVVSELLVGFVLTVVALVGMLAWAWHEMARVDDIREQVDRELAKRRAADEEVAAAKQREVDEATEALREGRGEGGGEDQGPDAGPGADDAEGG